MDKPTGKAGIVDHAGVVRYQSGPTSAMGAMPDDAKKALAAKKNLRVMDMDTTAIHKVTGFDLRRVMGGLLAQEWDLHRLERSSPRVDRIGADIANHIGAQRQHGAVAVERQLGIDDLVECLAGGGEILHAIAGPLHGAREQPRRRAHEDLLRIE